MDQPLFRPDPADFPVPAVPAVPAVPGAGAGAGHALRRRRRRLRRLLILSGVAGAGLSLAVQPAADAGAVRGSGARTVTTAAGDTPDGAELRFAPGATSTAVTARLSGSGSVTWTMRARRGQALAVAQWPCDEECPGGTAATGDLEPTSVTVTAADGTPVLSIDPGDVVAAAVLPADGIYRVTTTSPGSASVRLRVAVSPLTAARRAVQRIRFDRGSTAGVAVGTLRSGGGDTYVFRAHRGQTLDVSFAASSAATTTWVLVDPRGEPLHTTSTQQTQGSYPLPVTGEYTLRPVTSTSPSTYAIGLRID